METGSKGDGWETQDDGFSLGTIDLVRALEWKQKDEPTALGV